MHFAGRVGLKVPITSKKRMSKWFKSGMWAWLGGCALLALHRWSLQGFGVTQGCLELLGLESQQPQISVSSVSRGARIPAGNPGEEGRRLCSGNDHNKSKQPRLVGAQEATVCWRELGVGRC